MMLQEVVARVPSKPNNKVTTMMMFDQALQTPGVTSVTYNADGSLSATVDPRYQVGHLVYQTQRMQMMYNAYMYNMHCMLANQQAELDRLRYNSLAIDPSTVNASDII